MFYDRQPFYMQTEKPLRQGGTSIKMLHTCTLAVLTGIS